MPYFRLDEHAVVYSAPTAIPNDSAPKGCVMRPFNDLDLAKEYADQVCTFFAENGAPAPVFVVYGPTSTTKAKYEVVDATSTYSVAYRVEPPGDIPQHHTFADVVLANDAKKPLDEQACMHFMAITDMLNPKSGEELRDLSIARCKAFMERGVPCMSESHQGHEDTARQMLIQFLRFTWPEHCIDDIDQLFRGYLRAVKMPIHDELNITTSYGADNCAPTALQYAVDWGKARLMVALLEEGADETRVPMKPVMSISGTQVLAQPGDFIAYIESRLGINTNEMVTSARAALMRRHISQAQSPNAAVDADAAVAHRPARRASL